MGNENGQNQDILDRIATFIKSEEQVEPKQASEDDARTLRAAAGRLDQLLGEIKDQPRDKQVTAEDRKALRAAAVKLDQLLGDEGRNRTNDTKPHLRKKEATE